MNIKVKRERIQFFLFDLGQTGRHDEVRQLKKWNKLVANCSSYTLIPERINDCIKSFATDLCLDIDKKNNALAFGFQKLALFSQSTILIYLSLHIDFIVNNTLNILKARHICVCLIRKSGVKPIEETLKDSNTKLILIKQEISSRRSSRLF